MVLMRLVNLEFVTKLEGTLVCILNLWLVSKWRIVLTEWLHQMLHCAKYLRTKHVLPTYRT